MGVPLLLTWLRSTFPDCFHVFTGTAPYDELYLDFNSVLYQCVAAQQVVDSAAAGSDGVQAVADPRAFETMVLEGVVHALDHLVRDVLAPTKRGADDEPVPEASRKVLVIAVDGVSPRGKIAQQRGRRSRRAKEGAGGWDMSAVTAGTPFMHRVGALLEWYAVARSRSFQDLTVIVSDSAVPGEGEQKLMTLLRTRPAPLDAFAGLSRRACLCSNDTDVVLTALTIVDHEAYAGGLDILRWQAQGSQRRVSEGDRAANTTLPVQTLRAELCRRLGWDEWAEGGGRESVGGRPSPFTAAAKDVIFVLLLFGNDFVPRLPTMDVAAGRLDETLDFLSTNFVSRGKRIVHPTSHLLDLRAAHYLLSEIVAMNTSDVVGDPADASSRKRQRGGGLDIVLGSAADSTMLDWCAAAAPNSVADDSTAARCAEYWRGLQWTVQYYCGECPSWHWFYPFATAPTEAELVRHATATVTTQGSDSPLGALEQLVVVLPTESWPLLPKPVAAALQARTSPEADAFLGALETLGARLEPGVVSAFVATVRSLLSKHELSCVTTGAAYYAHWLRHASSPSRPEAVGDVVAAVEESVLAAFDGGVVSGLPGLDDSDSDGDLFGDFAQAAADNEAAPVTAEATASDEARGFTLLDGETAGGAIGRFVISDDALRVSGMTHEVVNVPVRGDGATFRVAVDSVDV